MNIEIWSDFVCPFCYIGKRHFEQALEQFETNEDIEIIFHSFELDPYAKTDPESDMHTLLARKYRMSVDRAKAMNAEVGRRAQEVGLTYHFDTMIPTNTFDAHRLSHLAKKYGKMYEMAERLFYAYFTESKHIGQHETLVQLATEVGLPREEAAEVLSSNAYADAVREDEREAHSLEIQGVPFFVINRKYAVSGAQPIEVFLDALQKAAADKA